MLCTLCFVVDPVSFYREAVTSQSPGYLNPGIEANEEFNPVRVAPYGRRPGRDEDGDKVLISSFGARVFMPDPDDGRNPYRVESCAGA